ncbi:MAG: phosphoribosylformylglycinamidine cyclo-ligase [Patescibacteria group bacterium]|nr:phosphoribosylformylglycinamidine cyclo-ligase [Patescibacteria group bacterium]
MTYEKAGVVYADVDSFKRRAQAEALKTREGNPLARLGFREISQSRGESVFLLESVRRNTFRLAHVEEGLGTKNLVADAMQNPFNYGAIAQDTVAMIVNDMITLGSFPLSMEMHLAVGSSDWFKDEDRAKSLIAGWLAACREARCVWGGGETPVLKGLVLSESFVISGSAVGVTKPRVKPMMASRIRLGDHILLAQSSGVHANGLTMCRGIAEKLNKDNNLEWAYRRLLWPSQFGSRVGGPPCFGEALLKPTPIYVPLVENLLDAGVDIHYGVNITGHGWRKLMRAPKPFTYRVEALPPDLPIFRFIQEQGGVEEREMYSTFNMGAGFALYVPSKYVKKAEEAGKRWGLFDAGLVCRSQDGRRRVQIVPKNILFEEEELNIR